MMRVILRRFRREREAMGTVILIRYLPLQVLYHKGAGEGKRLSAHPNQQVWCHITKLRLKFLSIYDTLHMNKI
jgi:hypothetical protein